MLAGRELTGLLQSLHQFQLLKSAPDKVIKAVEKVLKIVEVPHVVGGNF